MKENKNYKDFSIRIFGIFGNNKFKKLIHPITYNLNDYFFPQLNAIRKIQVQRQRNKNVIYLKCILYVTEVPSLWILCALNDPQRAFRIEHALNGNIIQGYVMYWLKIVFTAYSVNYSKYFYYSITRQFYYLKKICSLHFFSTKVSSIVGM